MAKRSKRDRKEYLRSREQSLHPALQLFLAGYDGSLANNRINLPETPESEKQFHLLLRLRWLVYDFLWVRLKLHPDWRNKRWFLDLFDVDEIRVEDDSVFLKGDIVWWAEGKDAQGQWWPADHEPFFTGVYKVTMRGDLNGGYWIKEPLTAVLKLSRTKKRNAAYQIEFGYGSTFLKIFSRR